MKKLSIYIAIFISFLSCDSEDASDCFQTAGETIEQEFEVDTFKNIVIHERVALVIKEGDTQKVVIETGENLLPDVTVEVVNNELIVRDNNACNYVRDYGLTTVYVTSPDIYRIRNASEQDVISDGTLTYSSIYLMSVGDKTDYLPVGDFHVTIENEKLRIWSNGIGVFYVNGSSNDLDLDLSNGDTRFEGENFIVKNIDVNQMSSNDALVYPTESLTGTIKSTGDIISYNVPSYVEIEEISGYGELIFK